MSNILSEKIKRAFGRIEFPSHCGLHAAVAMDDWISDEITLRNLTLEKDFAGDWWDVPIEHLLNCMTGLSYLDADGIEFYLPAYMVALIDRPEAFYISELFSRDGTLIFSMLPEYDDDEDFRTYFEEQFAKIVGHKKKVCREFLEFIRLDEHYSRQAKELSIKALESEYWANG